LICFAVFEYRLSIVREVCVMYFDAMWVVYGRIGIVNEDEWVP
jgi:hypothetical protein